MKELNFKEFRKIAQPKKVLTRPGQEKWYGLWIRKISVVLSYYIYKLPLNITPNMITSFMAVWGIVASALILLPKWWGILAFFLGYQFWTTLDSIDGEIARTKKIFSKAGEFLDSAAHIIIHPLAFLAIGLKFYFLSSDNLYLWLGVINMFLISLSNALYHSAKYWILENKLDLKREAYKTNILAVLASNLMGHIEINALGSLALMIFYFHKNIILVPLIFFGGYLLLNMPLLFWQIFRNYLILVKKT